MVDKHSEEDIQSVINYLKFKHPEKANRETAVKVLDGMQSFAKTFAGLLDEEDKKLDDNAGKELKEMAGLVDSLIDAHAKN